MFPSLCRSRPLLGLPFRYQRERGNASKNLFFRVPEWCFVFGPNRQGVQRAIGFSCNTPPTEFARRLRKSDKLTRTRESTRVSG